MKKDANTPMGDDLVLAQQLLQDGDIVAIPTETVYGLAGSAYSEKAVAKIFTTKNRPLTSPLIVHARDLSQVYTFVTNIPPGARRLAECFWPGPLTLLLEKKACIPNLVTAGLSTVGVRVADHPLTRLLLERLDFPLAAPSANPFGYISPTTAQHVAAQLGEEVPYILDGGPCQRGLESTIVGFPDGRATLYRLGSIPEQEICAALGEPVAFFTGAKKKEGDAAPGRTAHHYAPRTPIVAGDLAALFAKYRELSVAALCFDQPLAAIPRGRQVVLSPARSLSEAARGFFAGLHRLDEMGVDLIIAPIFPQVGLGLALNDRLRRACATHACGGEALGLR